MTVRVILEPPAPRAPSDSRRGWDFTRHALLAAGVAALGWCGWSWSEAWLHQEREESAFEELRTEARMRPLDERGVAPRVAAEEDRPKPAPFGGIARISIPRVHVRAIVEEGIDSRTLRRAVGHIPGTALPGQPGNVGLAAHRDTLFRGLRDIRKDDQITLETAKDDLEYVVDSIRIVTPKDVSVLKASTAEELTLVTCYPFNYVGSAPQRFIVRAHRTDARRDSSGF